MSQSVDEWLAKHGLEEFSATLRENDFTDVADVLSLSERDLADLGIALGGRKRFMRQLAAAQGGAPAAPAAAAPAQPAPAGAAAARPRLINTAALVRNPDGRAVEQAVSRLQTLLGNVVKHPGDARYRTLRGDNAILAKEVFAVDGVGAFLESVGFQRGADGNWALPAALGAPECSRALDALEQVPVALSMAERERQRRAMRDEIRREKREEAAKQGRERSYAEEELLALEDTCSLDTVCEWLRKVVGNVADSPDPKYRRVVIKPEGRFARECWNERGSQEFLLDVAGWQLTQEDGVDVLTCPPAAAKSAADSLVWLQEVADKARMLREEEAARQRELARKEMQEVMSQMKNQQRQQQQRDSKAMISTGSSGRRVPMKEALRTLLGAGGEEDPVKEQDDVATATISEISSLIEQEQLIRGIQGVIAPWRVESRKLLEKWKKDRDLRYLQDQLEHWQQKVELAKKQTGRTLADLGAGDAAARQNPQGAEEEAANQMLSRVLGRK